MEQQTLTIIFHLEQFGVEWIMEHPAILATLPPLLAFTRY
jgi:hypothetical protein